MAVPVSYMGTKRQLAEHVEVTVRQCRPGTFLDVFSGMCSVGRAIGYDRTVWSNDKQHFAALSARIQFTITTPPPNDDTITSILPIIQDQFSQICIYFQDLILLEKEANQKKSVDIFNRLFNQGSEFAQHCGISRTMTPFISRYGGTYFGFKQCAMIDAIRCSIEHAFSTGVIEDNDRHWLVFSLASALSKISTSTGHFAQPLRPKTSNIGKFHAQRKRCVETEWRRSVATLGLIGPKEWRSKNRVYQSDANSLLAELYRSSERPSVVYADPPYTKDQYSRFYHVYETLVLNDNPDVAGSGLYRTDRFVSDFCLMSRVEQSIETLIAQCAESRADLLLSYPTNGLLPDSEIVIPNMIQKHYRVPANRLSLPHIHSTFGASKGKTQEAVTENIYWVSLT